mmetsp:Transcript_10280/g.15655  ORF Transcript_10280/g.15655 Transcript_10280/m.15655 type:complete len:97 (-) Transcript_10280:1197-1487(-)
MKKQGGRQPANNVGSIRSNNDRFLFLFRKASKIFRIPQYGFETRKKTDDFALWRLADPQLVNNSYIVYNIKGKDNLSEFACQRRYNHFHTLRQVLN